MCKVMSKLCQMNIGRGTQNTFKFKRQIYKKNKSF